MNKITTIEIEEALARYFNPRQTLIVPNISWGMNLHECDLLIVRKSGYGIEVEIKVSKADLKKDRDKLHQHRDSRIKELYFAIPEYLQDCIEYIPLRAGVIVVSEYKYDDKIQGFLYCKTVRDAEVQKSTKFTDKEMYELARLGTLRIWGLKRKIIAMRKHRAKKVKSDIDQLRLQLNEK